MYHVIAKRWVVRSWKQRELAEQETKALRTMGDDVITVGTNPGGTVNWSDTWERIREFSGPDRILDYRPHPNPFATYGHVDYRLRIHNAGHETVNV